jgi:cytochrome P450
MGRTLLEQEGAEHRASRALVSPLFRAKLLERWRTELVEVVVHELIDRFVSRGRADLVREFTFAFPVQVIARLMGLPREDYVRFQQLSIELLSVVYNWDIGMAASATLKEYFGEILAERRDPRDDLIRISATSRPLRAGLLHIANHTTAMRLSARSAAPWFQRCIPVRFHVTKGR